MPLFTDMAERHDFLSLVLRVLMGALGALQPAWVKRGVKMMNVNMARLPGMMVLVAFAAMLSACSVQGGRDSLHTWDTTETPLGHYLQRVQKQLDLTWNRYRVQQPNHETFGSLKVVFYLNVKGKVENIHVKNTQETHPDLTRFTVKAIQDAELPPMPAEVVAALLPSDHGRLEIEHFFTAWPAKLSADRTAAARDADAKNTPKGRYIRQVLGQVEKKWHLYCKLSREGITYGRLIVEFYINKKGKVEDFRIVDDKESNPVLTDITKQAIFDAEIPPMPADVIPMLPKKDSERLKIDYNALIY